MLMRLLTLAQGTLGLTGNGSVTTQTAAGDIFRPLMQRFLLFRQGEERLELYQID